MGRAARGGEVNGIDGPILVGLTFWRQQFAKDFAHGTMPGWVTVKERLSKPRGGALG